MRIASTVAALFLALPLVTAQHIAGRGPHERRVRERRSAVASSSASKSASVSSSASTTTRTSSSSTSTSTHSSSSTTSSVPLSTSSVFKATSAPSAFAASASTTSACAPTYKFSILISGTGTLPKPTAFVTKATGSNQLTLSGKPYKIVGPSACFAFLRRRDSGFGCPSADGNVRAF